MTDLKALIDAYVDAKIAATNSNVDNWERDKTRLNKAEANLTGYLATQPPSPTANVKWYLCDGTQPVAISVIAAYFDDILGEWVCDVIDPPFSWNEHAYLGQYTYWTPLSAILPPTGFPRNP